MSWRQTRASVVHALLVSVVGVACAQNPTPATPAPASTGKPSDAYGQSMAGLNFDPQGADFTVWVNRFMDEVYCNWIVPQAALFGAARGHADFEFTVERDGKMSALRLVKSSGTVSLDVAARTALAESRLLKLPDDYGPPRVTMQTSFYYGEKPE